MTRNILYGGQLAGGVECQKSEREGEQQLEDVPTTPIEVNINTTSTHPTLHIWLRLKHSGSFDPAVLSSSFSAYYYRSFASGHDNAHSFHSSIHEEGCAVIDGSEGEVRCDLSVSRYVLRGVRAAQPPHTTIADTVGAISAGRHRATATLRPGISPFVNQHSSNGRNTAKTGSPTAWPSNCI